MSNDIKRKQSLVIAIVDASTSPKAVPRDQPVIRGAARRGVEDSAGHGGVATAWAALMALLGSLLGLMALLPAPTAVLELAGAGVGGVDAAVLAGASVLVWALTGWVAAVALVAAAGVLPGAGGRSARALLRLIAPQVALRLVAVAVGASALAGTTACAAPLFAAPLSSPVSTAVAPSGAVASGSVSSGSVSSGSVSSDAESAAPSMAASAIDPPTAEVAVPVDWPTAADTPTATPEEQVTMDIEWPSTDSPAGAPFATVTAPAPGGPTVPGPTIPPPAPASAASTTAVTPSMSPTGDPQPPVPAAPANPQSPVPAATANPLGGAAVERVVVQPGDTLWSLAQRTLPAGADDSAIDTSWRQWYAANREVIGADPDRIEPGQALTSPTVDERTSR